MCESLGASRVGDVLYQLRGLGWQDAEPGVVIEQEAGMEVQQSESHHDIVPAATEIRAGLRLQ